MPNFAWMTGKSLPNAKNEQVFEDYNFSQMLPNTPIFEGVTGLIFRKCNLSNCNVPQDALVENCLQMQVSFCTNLFPAMIEKGLTACKENCSHLVGIDEVTIDGVIVDTVNYYEDTLI